jgi:hypothetical protein
MIAALTKHTVPRRNKHADCVGRRAAAPAPVAQKRAPWWREPFETEGIKLDLEHWAEDQKIWDRQYDRSTPLA